MKKPAPEIALLLAALDEAYDRRSWHGTNLRGSLRGLTVEDTAWRPQEGRHNIHEIAVHAAYWKHIVARCITGASGRGFLLAGSNWFPRNVSDAAGWRGDLALLAEQHGKLRAAVEALDPKALAHSSPRGRYTFAGLIRGVAAHDLYHAGQIQLLKRMRRAALAG